jgi:CheY-like chemotaxis protein
MAALAWTLVIEDAPDHQRLISEAVAQVAGDVPIHQVADGADAISWLRKRLGDPEALRGGMVIMDLGLPRISGFQVLEWMREMPQLMRIPAVVLTASENPIDKEHALNLGASGYFQKPQDPRQYVAIFQKVFHGAEESFPA